MENPVYDLIIGNVSDARLPEKPDHRLSKLHKKRIQLCPKFGNMWKTI